MAFFDSFNDPLVLLSILNDQNCWKWVRISLFSSNFETFFYSMTNHTETLSIIIQLDDIYMQ